MRQEFDFFVLEPLGKNCVIVDQIGYVDLRVAFANSVVSGDLTSVEADYNGIEDPRSMIGSPDDVFSALRAQKAYSEASKSSDGASSPMSPEGGADA